MKLQKKDYVNAAMVTMGNLLYAIGLCVIITPLHLYSGGFTGIAQLIRLLMVEGLHVNFGSFNILGFIYFAINVPFFLYALKVMGKKFCIRTLISIVMCSVFLTLLPVPATPIIEDKLFAAIVGGIINGTGAGLTLRGGSSQGGQDLLGACLAKTHPDFKVGTIGIIISVAVYSICFFIYDVETVLYSIVYAVLVGVAIDKVHIQNIKMQAIIVTKKEEMIDAILTNINRGATLVEGKGAYTKDDTHIIITVISQYEERSLREQIKQIDPSAFVVITSNARVIGNFEKRFE